MTSDGADLVPAERKALAGFVTQVRDRGMAPAMMAEQQRAKSEIEAALTIAAARPRDQKEAMDRILTSCQRPGLAAKAKYRYSKGGTEIEGVTIDLMEVVAQMWGNLDFGFRELARFPGVAGGAGESVVEAFAWDMETNVKRKVQFTVQHAERTKRGTRIITDPRDIYEWVANQAQRRVRTCLENIIPRDIYEAAAEECENTMRANVGNLEEAIGKAVAAFAEYGVTKEMLEARFQRRIETISAAQVVYLKNIYRGLRDGISHPQDWFDMTLGQEGSPASQGPSPAGVAEVAKEKMRQNQAQAAHVAPPSPPPSPRPVVTVDGHPVEGAQPMAVPLPPARAPVSAAQPIVQPAEAAAPEPPVAPVAPEAPSAAQAPESPPAASGGMSDELLALVEEYRVECDRSETLAGLRELRKHVDGAGAAVLEACPDAKTMVLQLIAEAEDRIKATRGVKNVRN